MPVEIDLLPLTNATVTAPAGCGKTELIADALSRHTGRKPILVLTHTNAGVAALRWRLDRAQVSSSTYRISTIDAWAIRIVSMFPARSLLDPELLTMPNPDYPEIRAAAIRLLSGQHIHDVLSASYEKLIVDEYQDCTVPQHEMICHASGAISTVLLGDPMQAIFGWQGNEPPDWATEVCARFPIAGQLQTPWRWRKAGTEDFGRWLMDARLRLERAEKIDLTTAPAELTRMHLSGSKDDEVRRRAAQTTPTNAGEKVIILGQRTPANHHWVARHTPGAVVVEAVDLRDLVAFAQQLDFSLPEVALERIVRFADGLMTGVGPDAILNRVRSLRSGTARLEATKLERAAIAFLEAPTPIGAADLISQITAAPGVRQFRTGVIRAAIRALRQCDGSVGNTFPDAAIRIREQNGMVGRPLAERSVGSTFLLKGLEADLAVILYADEMDARHLYVAMTRGARKLVMCTRSTTLVPFA